MKFDCIYIDIYIYYILFLPIMSIYSAVFSVFSGCDLVLTSLPCVISRQWKDDIKRFCVMRCCTVMSRILPPVGIQTWASHLATPTLCMQTVKAFTRVGRNAC